MVTDDQAAYPISLATTTSRGHRAVRQEASEASVNFTARMEMLMDKISE